MSDRGISASPGVALLVWLVCMVLSGGAGSLQAADVVVEFDNPEQSSLYHSLLREYRCLKCQNQNLADSNAGLAEDLRREIREQILAGKLKPDIDEYLVARYGEFVLYRPRFNAKTAILWVGPFVLGAAALASLFLMSSRRGARRKDRLATASDYSLSPEQLDLRLDRARRLLDDEK